MAKTSGPRSRARAAPRRADQARRGASPTGSKRSGPTPKRWRVGWARRVGIAGGLVLAVVSVAFAAQSLGPGFDPPGGSVRPSTPLLTGNVAAMSPPVLDAIAGPVTTASIDVRGHLAAALPDDATYRVRIYVNNRFRREARLTKGDPVFAVGDVPLAEGDNTITATIGAGDAESAASTSVIVSRDTTAPPIDITSPTGSTVYGDTLLLKGATEPGARMTLTNRSTGASTDATAAQSGDFSLSLHLQPGSNVLDVTAEDQAGNRDQQRLTLTRTESQANMTIELSRDAYDLATLPQTITMVAHVIGPDGKPADDASITFSISPPGQTTVTRQATTVDGMASWTDFPLTVPGAQSGRGLVTALATLADGETVAGSATFSFR